LEVQKQGCCQDEVAEEVRYGDLLQTPGCHLSSLSPSHSLCPPRLQCHPPQLHLRDRPIATSPQALLHASPTCGAQNAYEFNHLDPPSSCPPPPASSLSPPICGKAQT
jgi:hypothetical protein